MRHSKEFRFLVRSFGRSFDDGGIASDKLDVEVWNSAKSIFHTRKLLIDDTSYEVKIDWAPLLRRYSQSLAATEYVYRGGSKDVGRRLMRARFPRRPANLQILVNSTSPKCMIDVAESVIHDVFLIANLAVPGSCNFYRTELIADDREQEISLSNYLFESSFLHSREKGWPKIEALSLEKVATWFNTIRKGAAQIPNSPVEHTLFALLHLAKLEGDQVSVIWIFYALESLLQTRAGENFSSIVKRLTLLLELEDKQEAALKRALRDLYNVRSAIVHGGFKVSHPMDNEVLDSRVDAAFGEMLDRLSYGYVIIIAALQVMIKKDWSQLKFNEVLVGSR